MRQRTRTNISPYTLLVLGRHPCWSSVKELDANPVAPQRPTRFSESILRVNIWWSKLCLSKAYPLILLVCLYGASGRESRSSMNQHCCLQCQPYRCWRARKCNNLSPSREVICTCRQREKLPSSMAAINWFGLQLCKMWLTEIAYQFLICKGETSLASVPSDLSEAARLLSWSPGPKEPYCLSKL